MNLLKGSIFLKLLALAVALLTYFYIRNEIYNAEEKHSADASYKLIKLTAKNLPVKVRLATQPPGGYRITDSAVTASPAMVTVIGPEALLEEAWHAETSLVDVSEYTKTVIRQIPLESVAGVHLVGNPYLVDVTVPIEKLPEPEPEPGEAPPAAVETPLPAATA